VSFLLRIPQLLTRLFPLQGGRQPVHHAVYDTGLLAVCFSLLFLGLIMVASASVHTAEQRFGDPLYYFWRQLLYTGIGCWVGLFIIKIPIRVWQKVSSLLLMTGIIFLVLVLIPPFGREINGSMRWLHIGSMSIQPSEFIKLIMVLYLAGYLVRRGEEVRRSLVGFLKPIFVVCIITGLFLLEPDYGATVVLFATVLGMLFIAGVPIRQFNLWIIIIGFVLGALVISAPYRLERLVTFVNPWADPFNSGFQLTQALIAIGRGGFLGVGLGNSVQKLTYLPEAHTDFIFAILAEELGLVGILVTISLFSYLIIKAFSIALKAELQRQIYAAYLSYGIGLLLGLQTIINLGVNMGLLPTKGLTLPLMSYGGSSLLVTCMMLALLLRIDFELRLKQRISNKYANRLALNTH